MDMDIWLAFVAASVALLMIPGPTVLLVLSYALSKGRQVAVAAALGVAVGDFIAMTASLVGLGALVMASATLFTVLKWAGAVYLVWLGIKLWRSASGEPDAGVELAATRDVQARGIFGHTAMVTALNPKSIGFFIAFVPQFIHPEGSLAPQFAILIATFVILAGLNALAFAVLADRMRGWIARPAVVANLTRGGGVALIGMGLTTAFLRRPV